MGDGGKVVEDEDEGVEVDVAVFLCLPLNRKL
jgi:hypothetical protein